MDNQDMHGELSSVLNNAMKWIAQKFESLLDERIEKLDKRLAKIEKHLKEDK